MDNKPQTTIEILNHVIDILKQRENNYADPIDNFEAIGIVWTVFLANADKLKEGSVIDSLDVSRMMVGLKMVRDSHKYQDDNWDDTIGYGACGRRIGSVINNTKSWVGKIGKLISSNR